MALPSECPDAERGERTKYRKSEKRRKSSAPLLLLLRKVFACHCTARFVLVRGTLHTASSDRVIVWQPQREDPTKISYTYTRHISFSIYVFAHSLRQQWIRMRHLLAKIKRVSIILAFPEGTCRRQQRNEGLTLHGSQREYLKHSKGKRANGKTPVNGCASTRT